VTFNLRRTLLHGVNSLTPHVIPLEDNSDDTKDSFHEEPGHVFNQFLRYHMKILLEEFSAKVGIEYIFKPTIGNESLHEISNDTGLES
jgi:hypothetical protein